MIARTQPVGVKLDTEPTPLPRKPPCERCQDQRDSTRELALLIRQGLKLIVVGIERKYGLTEQQKHDRAA